MKDSREDADRLTEAAERSSAWFDEKGIDISEDPTEEVPYAARREIRTANHIVEIGGGLWEISPEWEDEPVVRRCPSSLERWIRIKASALANADGEDSDEEDRHQEDENDPRARRRRLHAERQQDRERTATKR